MSVIDADRSYSGEMQYWGVVQATLTRVFGIEEKAALTMVRGLVERMADASPTERLMAFNIEPLQVASDLCGGEVGPDAIGTYLGLSSELGRVGKR